MQPKLGHKIAFSSLALTVLVFLAGFLYVYYSDKQSTATAKQAATVIQSNPITPPKAAAANAKVGVSIETISSPIARGASAIAAVQTVEGASCSIEISYGSVKDTSPSLKPIIADAYGVAQWSWIIPKNAAIGSWPVKITCVRNSNSGVVDGSILITSS